MFHNSYTVKMSCAISLEWALRQFWRYSAYTQLLFVWEITASWDCSFQCNYSDYISASKLWYLQLPVEFEYMKRCNVYTWVLNSCIIKLYHTGFDPIKQLGFLLKNKCEKPIWWLLSDLVLTNKPFTLDFWKTKWENKKEFHLFFLFSEECK